MDKVAHNSTGLSIGGNMRVNVHTSYAEVPIDEQIEKADVIVAGTIESISGTRWNQDSGEYWEETDKREDREHPHLAVAFYTMEISVDRPIVTDRDLADRVEITVVGTSPLDDKRAEFPVEVGDKVVIFAKRSELAWRDGRRQILMFLSAPESSLFWQGEDGLYRMSYEGKSGVSFEELISRIVQKRRDVIKLSP